MGGPLDPAPPAGFNWSVQRENQTSFALLAHPLYPRVSGGTAAALLDCTDPTLVFDVESVLHRDVVKFAVSPLCRGLVFYLAWAPAWVSLQPPDAVWAWQLFMFV